MTFRHSGDLGDIIYLMPVLKSIGGKHTVFFVDRCKVPPYSQPLVRRADVLIPLFESQDYIEKVECSEEDVDVDMSKFRVFHRPTRTLTEAQADYHVSVAGASSNLSGIGSQPWILAKPSNSTSGRIIISRSQRYHNLHFPWKEIHALYGDRLLFVGLPVEHMVFQSRIGPVEYLKTDNFLQLAECLSGAEMFIGNQSSPMSVAIGVGVRTIQETCIDQPDCIFKRDNIQYVGDGSCVLPDIGGSGSLTIEPKMDKDLSSMSVDQVPPGSWQYPGLPEHTHFQVIQSDLMKFEGISKDKAREKIIIHNMKRCPDFFKGQMNDPMMRFSQAMAGIGK